MWFKVWFCWLYSSSSHTTSYYEEERQSQRLKLKGDKEVAQEQLDKLVTGQSMCVHVLRCYEGMRA